MLTAGKLHRSLQPCVQRVPHRRVIHKVAAHSYLHAAARAPIALDAPLFQAPEQSDILNVSLHCTRRHGREKALRFGWLATACTVPQHVQVTLGWVGWLQLAPFDNLFSTHQTSRAGLTQHASGRTIAQIESAIERDLKPTYEFMGDRIFVVGADNERLGAAAPGRAKLEFEGVRTIIVVAKGFGAVRTVVFLRVCGRRVPVRL